MTENKNFIVKICGFKDPTEAPEILILKPTMIGLIFAPGSPRCVELNNARKIARYAQAQDISVAGVFQNQNIEYVSEVIEELSLDYVQLHGEENVLYCAEMKIPVIKKINVNSSLKEIKLLMNKYSGIVNYFLIDRPVQGHGEAVDLKAVKELAENFPVILAGGLDKDNIENTINEIGENLKGVDTCSGVESSPGMKDPDMVRSFISKAGRSYASL